VAITLEPADQGGLPWATRPAALGSPSLPQLPPPQIGTSLRHGRKIPGHKTKMMHFEIGVSDLDASIALVVEAGGSIAPHQPKDRDQNTLRVMLDPSGHPFCRFVLS
jgi:hypothetical protein